MCEGGGGGWGVWGCVGGGVCGVVEGVGCVCGGVREAVVEGEMGSVCGGARAKRGGVGGGGVSVGVVSVWRCCGGGVDVGVWVSS